MSALALSWALQTAEVQHLQVADRAGQVIASARLPVATPAALVALKSFTMPERRSGQPTKLGTDAYDVYLLVTTRGSVVRRGLADAPEVLRSGLVVGLRLYFGTQGDRVHRAMSQAVRRLPREELDRVVDFASTVHAPASATPRQPDKEAFPELPPFRPEGQVSLHGDDRDHFPNDL